MISVNDLLVVVAVFFGSCLLMAVGVALTITLINISNVAKKVSKLIDDNAASVNKTFKLLPGLAESMDKAGASIKVNADKVGGSLTTIEGMFFDSTAAAEESTLKTIVSIGESILKLIMNYFAKKEKD